MWTKGPAPWEYVEYILYRYVFHCTPVQLRALPPEDILVALTILGVEADVREMYRQMQRR